MNTTNNTNAFEIALLSTVLNNDKFNEMSKDQDFQEYVLAQKEIISRLLVSGYNLAGNSKSITHNIEMPHDLAEEIIKPEPKTEVPASSEIDILSDVTNICSEITGYPKEMLEPELDLEADLGIDTVKQMEILSILRDKYNHRIEEHFTLSETPTLSDVTQYLSRVH